MTFLHYAPLYMFYAEILILRTNIYSLLFSIQIYVVNCGFMHQQEVLHKIDSLCPTYGVKSIIKGWILGNLIFVPALVGVYV